MTATYKGRGFGYEEVNVPRGDDGARRTVSRFTCIKCPQTIDAATLGINAVKFAENAGWSADQFRKDRVFCPECRSKRKTKTTMPSEEKVVSINQPQKGPPPSLVIADPTNDQRYQIRQKLDTCFDDKIGAYLDGMTDQKLGAMLNLPAILITRIREAAYGPILVDEATLKFNRRMEDLEAKVHDAQAILDDIVLEMKEVRDEFHKRTAAA